MTFTWEINKLKNLLDLPPNTTKYSAIKTKKWFHCPNTYWLRIAQTMKTMNSFLDFADNSHRSACLPAMITWSKPSSTSSSWPHSITQEPVRNSNRHFKYNWIGSFPSCLTTSAPATTITKNLPIMEQQRNKIYNLLHTVSCWG